MRKLLIALLLCVFFLESFSQKKVPPVIEWQKSLGGSRVDKAYTIIPTFDNGYLVVGESYSNNGDVTGHHGSTDSSDAWVVKLNATGSIQWQRSYGGTRNDRIVDVIQVGNGDFICIGSSESNNGDVSGLHDSESDLWVMRISSTGNIIWSKLYGGTYAEGGQVIKNALDGGYILAGYAQSMDFDVSGNHGYQDIWVVKIDDAGALQWQKCYGNGHRQFTTDLIITNDGNYVISGYSTEGTRPPGCQVIYSYWEEARLKIDPAGNPIWQHIPNIICGNPGVSNFNSNLIEMPSGRLFYVGAHVNSTTQSNPYWKFGYVNTSNGQTISISHTEYLFFNNWVNSPFELGPHKSKLMPDSTILTCAFSVYDQNSPGNISGSLTLINPESAATTADTFANFKFKSRYGGTNTDVFSGIHIIDELQYISAGYSNSNNGDVSGNHGDYDFWVVKFSSLNKIKGKVFVDNNSNGFKDANETYATNYLVESKKNGLAKGNGTDASGNFLNHVDTGTYTTTVKLKNTYYTTNPASKQSTFTTLNNKDSFDFALVPIPGKKDLRIDLQGLNRIRPGGKSEYRMDYVNQGTENISNVQVRFIKPSNVDYESAVPVPTQVNGDTIIWNIGSVNSLDSSFILLTLRAQPLPGVDLGDVLWFYGEINPIAGDETPLDNKDSLRQVASGSFDPNDKIENFDGEIYLEQLNNFRGITYTIRFQNTGTDTAFDIIVRDTLTAKLDPASLEIVGVSHPYTFTIKDSKYLTWTFSDIKLVDSNINESLSHGYISYRIKSKVPLVLNDTVSNSASIYFDYNPPVKTNTQLTIVKPNPLSQPVISGIASNYCNNQGIQKGKILNLPATGSGITVTAKLDGTVYPVAADSSFSFNVDTLPGGNHSITVTFTNSSGNKTTTQNFTNTISVSPNVNLSANITTITNLATPVVITATNATGGGTTPKFTFAKDRNFNTILQGEGNGNTFNLDPSTLTVGENWIYVRMKTSETCYILQTNSDSIKLIRDQSTGIIDPDNPNRIINVYPNPFDQEILINGLSTGKTYSINLYNSYGQLMFKQRVVGRSSANMNRIALPGGIYLLSIFDEEKKILLGTVKISKK